MDREHMRNMRWLYDDEASYQKAMRRLRLEELKAQKDKERLRLERKQRLEDLKLKTVPVIAHAAKKSGHLTRRFKMGRRVFAVVGILLVFVSLAAVWQYVQSRHSRPVKLEPSATVKAKPTFDPVVKPQSEKATDTKYDASKKVLSFADTINGAKLIISQQPLPKQFSDNPAKFGEFLDTIPNRQAVEYRGGTAYLAVMDDGRVQFSVFSTPTVLAFVRSDEPLQKADWQKYYAGLRLQ